MAPAGSAAKRSRARVRPYAPADEPSVVRLLNQRAADLRALPWLVYDSGDFVDKPLTYVTDQERDKLVDRTGVVAACAGPEVVGTASCWCSPDDGVALLQWIAVAGTARRRGIGSMLLRWCEQRALANGCRELQTERWVDSRNRALCRFLTANGFRARRRSHMNVTMRAALRPDRLDEVALSRGYRVTTFSSGDEADWVRLKNALFGSSTTVESFIANQQSREDFLPEGWFFAESRGRKLGIANVIPRAHRDREELAGTIEWVGTLPEARGRGLGRALVIACMRRLYEWGLDDALLLTQYFRQPAVALYRSLGFRVAREHRLYAKRLGEPR